MEALKKWLKRIFWILLAGAAVWLLMRAFEPEPVLVDAAVIERGELVMTVEDDGRTRIRERYTISAPMDGRLLRPPLKLGDRVEAQETIVANFEPQAPQLLDVRSKAEAREKVRRAEAALNEAKALQEKAKADLVFAETDLARQRALHKRGTVADEIVDRAERSERMAKEDVRAYAFAVEIAEHELHIAQAGLLEDAGKNGEALRRISIPAPIDGQVIRVFEESARSVVAGTPILEIGNTELLEVVAELLSQDAVKVKAGMEVSLENWGEDVGAGRPKTLAGRVRLIEPSGFTKVSALGVEEQRVNIIIDPAEPLEAWDDLQEGYGVDARIVISRHADVVIVPTGALFREGEDWAVLVIEEGFAKTRRVKIGRQNGVRAELKEGLEVGERVILYPSELVEDGSAVEVR